MKFLADSLGGTISYMIVQLPLGDDVDNVMMIHQI
jgi:hypothetical protein